MTETPWQTLAMAYMDGELPDDEARRFEAFLAAHPEIAAEVAAMQEIQGLTARVRLPSPPDGYWAEFPKNVWTRINRWFGWILYLVGVVILAAYAAYAFFVSPASTWVKIGVAALILGLLLLFGSVIRQRLQEAKSDRYSSEVIR